MTPSRLHHQVEEYLVIRRALGFALTTQEWMLRDLVCHADRVGHAGPLTRELVVGWALTGSSGKPGRAARRLQAARALARHLALTDPATEVPPVDLLGRVPHRRRAHIYSDAELAGLLDQARQLLPRRGLRPQTYLTLFGLLAATGLRLSEALALERAESTSTTASLLCVPASTARPGSWRYTDRDPGARPLRRRARAPVSRWGTVPAHRPLPGAHQGRGGEDLQPDPRPARLERAGSRGTPAHPRPAPHLRRAPAARLVPGGRRPGTPAGRPVDLPRPRPAQRHLLVPDRHPGADGDRRPALRGDRPRRERVPAVTAASIGFATLVQEFFGRRLVTERGASAHTIASYRDTFELLLGYAETRTGRTPSALRLADLDAPLVLDFLDHLEADRGNAARTRNLRLTAIRSFMRYASLRAPDQLALTERVLAISPKRFDRPALEYCCRPLLSSTPRSPAAMTSRDAPSWPPR